MSVNAILAALLEQQGGSAAPGARISSRSAECKATLRQLWSNIFCDDVSNSVIVAVSSPDERMLVVPDFESLFGNLDYFGTGAVHISMLLQVPACTWLRVRPTLEKVRVVAEVNDFEAERPTPGTPCASERPATPTWRTDPHDFDVVTPQNH